MYFNLTQNGEAWTNLASAHIKVKQKREAWRALRESIRNMFDSYKIWENYLYCSIDLFEFKECIISMQRLLDLRWDKLQSKEKSVDIEVLTILSNAIIDNVQDADSVGGNEHLPQLITLLNDMTSKIATSPEIFTVCAKVFKFTGDYKKSLEFTTKAFRIMINHPEVLYSTGIFKLASEYAILLCDAYSELGPLKQIPRMGDEEEVIVCKDWEYQSKSLLKTLIARGRNSFEGLDIYEKLLIRLENF